jgi:ABC-type branched-subunit amino acid transport system ATPase component/branched-subunit amino acid ABC-type transport system permease component
VYALAGTGLVLTYRTTGIFNFAFGAIAAVAVFLFYVMHVEHGWPWPLAAAICVFVIGPAIGLLLERLGDRISSARPVTKITTTIGIVLLIENLANILFGPSVRLFPSFLPTNQLFSITGVGIDSDQLILIAVGFVGAAGLYVVLRYTPVGVRMRAAVDAPDLLELGGTNPVVARRWAWVISCSFAMVAGLLLAPVTNLNVSLLTLLVIQGFAAAALGYFSSLPITYAGGIALGIIASFATKFIGTVQWLGGLPVSIPFLVLFLVLILVPRRRLSSDSGLTRIVDPPAWKAPPRVRGTAYGIAVVALAVVPFFAGPRLGVWTNGLVFILLFLSLGLLVRTSGQVSLCQMAFAAMGATSFSHFHSFGIPWLPALLLAMLSAVPFGLIVAIPAVRISGLYLALATYGFSILVENVLYTSSIMFGDAGATGLPEPRPKLGSIPIGSDRGFYYVVLLIVIICTAAMLLLHRTRLGRLLRALKEAPLALSTQGVNLMVTRLLVFSLSAAMAALAGALLGSSYTAVNSGSFGSDTSLTILVLLGLQATGAPWYAIGGAAALTIIPGYLTFNANITSWLGVLFGASAVVVAISGFPSTPQWLRRLLSGEQGKKTSLTDTALLGDDLSESDSTIQPIFASSVLAPTGDVSQNLRSEQQKEEGGLEVERLVVTFGGMRAVDGVHLSAPLGRITGLIGPNGAGKTTIFNAACGIASLNEGIVKFRGQDITRLDPSARARRGLGRTFQLTELCESLTVWENVILGREGSLAGRNPLTQLRSRSGDARRIAESASEAMAFCNLELLSDVQAGLLSTGQRRLVELARCISGRFDVLLLDEPSSGLDVNETLEVSALLRRLVDERGVGVLLVEHDMSMVMDICSYVFVIDFGIPIFEGTPDEVQASAAVREAYLGTEEPPSTVELPANG